MSKNKITEILKHDISWNVLATSVKELDEVSIEHIEKCIQDGYTQGELHISFGKSHEKETSGWWRIINWKNIALDLRNSFLSKASDDEKDRILKAAIARFDKEWTY